MILLAMLKDLKHFARIMNVGVLAAMINGGAIALGGVIRWIGFPACQSEKDSRYAAGECIFRTAFPPTDETSPIFQVGMAASVCLFGIMVAGSYPNTRHQMAEPQRIECVALTSFWLTLVIFGVVMVGGYLGTGQAVKDNALDSFDTMPILHYTGLSAQVIDTLVASPIYILCVINAFESTGTDGLRTPLALPNVMLRAATVALVTTLSAVVPYPEIIMIEASFFGIFTHLVWPVFLTAMLKRKWIAAGRDPARVQVICVRRGARMAIMFFGLVVCFFSIYGAAQKLSAEISNA
jgi:amino acid permease